MICSRCKRLLIMSEYCKNELKIVSNNIDIFIDMLYNGNKR